MVWGQWKCTLSNLLSERSGHLSETNICFCPWGHQCSIAGMAKEWPRIKNDHQVKEWPWVQRIISPRNGHQIKDGHQTNEWSRSRNVRLVKELSSVQGMAKVRGWSSGQGIVISPRKVHQAKEPLQPLGVPMYSCLGWTKFKPKFVSWPTTAVMLEKSILRAHPSLILWKVKCISAFLCTDKCTAKQSHEGNGFHRGCNADYLQVQARSGSSEKWTDKTHFLDFQIHLSSSQYRPQMNSTITNRHFSLI